jgi:hypothetical protein
MKNKEKIHASFSVVLQTAKFTTIKHKVLMKVGKALNFWVEDMNRKRVPTLLNFIIHLMWAMFYFA